ncbi:polyprenol monophosphomannose synthase [bacterium]|nr:polyprenol monophosphomannose synthase [bacterium]
MTVKSAQARSVNAKALICIPTYNEADNVEILAKRIFEVVGDRCDILFADDNSPDGTGQLCDKLARENPQIHVLHGKEKGGLAKAYINAFRWGMEKDYDWFFEMDADFSHDPIHLAQFLELIDSGTCDAICGSRYIKGGGVSNWSKGRLFLSRGGSIYSTFWLGYPVNDWTGGFNAWSRATLKALHLDQIGSKGYTFQIELKYRTLVLGRRLVETPIVFQERRAGQSKMSGSIVKEAILAVALLRWKNVTNRLFAPKLVTT